MTLYDASPPPLQLAVVITPSVLGLAIGRADIALSLSLSVFVISL